MLIGQRGGPGLELGFQEESVSGREGSRPWGSLREQSKSPSLSGWGKETDNLLLSLYT